MCWSAGARIATQLRRLMLKQDVRAFSKHESRLYRRLYRRFVWTAVWMLIVPRQAQASSWKDGSSRSGRIEFLVRCFLLRWSPKARGSRASRPDQSRMNQRAAAAVIAWLVRFRSLCSLRVELGLTTSTAPRTARDAARYVYSTRAYSISISESAAQVGVQFSKCDLDVHYLNVMSGSASDCVWLRGCVWVQWSIGQPPTNASSNDYDASGT